MSQPFPPAGAGAPQYAGAPSGQPPMPPSPAGGHGPNINAQDTEALRNGVSPDALNVLMRIVPPDVGVILEASCTPEAEAGAPGAEALPPQPGPSLQRPTTQLGRV